MNFIDTKDMCDSQESDVMNLIKEAGLACVPAIENKRCPLFALDFRVEGSRARSKQISKSNQRPPPSDFHPLPPELICIWSPDHVLFISNHNQSGKKLINEGARQEWYPPSGGCADPSTPWKALTPSRTNTGMSDKRVHVCALTNTHTQTGSRRCKHDVRKTCIHTCMDTQKTQQKLGPTSQTHTHTYPLACHSPIFRWLIFFSPATNELRASPYGLDQRCCWVHASALLPAAAVN